MASWKKLINSGSNAHVESLEILSPPTLSPSLEVDGGVFFHNLPDQDDLPWGTLMKIEDGGLGGAIENIGNSKFVIISNAPIDEGEEEEEDYNIPWNEANLDFNGDGEIGSGNLLPFLIAYGEAEGDVSYNSNFDTNGDGEVGSADLLVFLIAYGATLEELAGTMNDLNILLPNNKDRRPPIAWNISEYDWIDDDSNSDTYNYVTADSVRTYYETFTNPFAIDGFWSKLGYDPDDAGGEGSGVYRHIFRSNPPAYNADTFPYEYIDIFIYLYFTQTTGGVFGGNTYYNRNGVQTTGTLTDNFPPDGVTPIGFGPYPS